MKKYITILVVLALAYFLWQQSGHVSKEVTIVNKILSQSARNIKDKYKLVPVGSGAAMFKGPLRELCLDFYSYSALNKEQLRSLIISSVNEVVQLVNSNPNALAILYEPPFTFKNVNIVIYNLDAHGNTLHDPEIGVARISNGNLGFSTNDRYSKKGYKNTVEESYEDAVKLLEASR